MARYRQKPDMVDARQFVGGAENAHELSTWLKKTGDFEVTWVDNQTVMDIHLVERLQFVTPSKLGETQIALSAYRQDWIVKKGDHWRIFSNKEFGERFEAV